MTLFIRRFLLFVVVTAIIYISLFGILFFIKAKNIPVIFRTTQGNVFEGGITYVKFRQFDPNEKYDIFLLGSSHAYRGYDPAIFREYGYNMFNFGSINQSTMVSYFIAKNFIRKSNCKLVIIDVYEYVFMFSNIESISDMIQNISSDKVALQISLASRDLRTINMYTMRLFNKFEAPLDSDTVGVVQGFIPRTTQLKLPGKPKLKGYKTNPKSVKYFNKLVELLHARGINVIITEHPLPSVYSISKENHGHFIDDIMPVLKKYNIPFYDYTHDSTMAGIQYFSDENHLSLRGINKYDRALLNKLLQDGRLPPVKN